MMYVPKGTPFAAASSFARSSGGEPKREGRFRILGVTQRSFTSRQRSNSICEWVWAVWPVSGCQPSGCHLRLPNDFRLHLGSLQSYQPVIEQALPRKRFQKRVVGSSISHIGWLCRHGILLTWLRGAGWCIGFKVKIRPRLIVEDALRFLG